MDLSPLAGPCQANSSGAADSLKHCNDVRRRDIGEDIVDLLKDKPPVPVQGPDLLPHMLLNCVGSSP